LNESAVFIISMCATVALCSFASYSGGEARTTRLALGIILLSSLLSPALELISELDFTQGAPSPLPPSFGEDMREEELKRAFSEGIESAIINEFSFDERQLSVEVGELDVSSMTVGFCRVRLYGRAALCDPRRVERFVLGCGVKKCEVTASV